MAGYNPSTDSGGWVKNSTAPVYSTDQTALMTGGIILPQGTSAPLQVGAGVDAHLGQELWTVSRLSTGKIKVSLVNGANLSKVKTIRASLQLASSTNLKVSVSTVTSSPPSFELDVVNAQTGALTDISANAANAIHWRLFQSLASAGNISNS